MDPDAVRTIAALALEPHPEGGFFREVYRSEATVRAANGRTRPALTVIYYLLASGMSSAWHRLASDETWHFARGRTLVLELIDAAGAATSLELAPEGPWVAAIPAGTAFAARVPDGYALVTCCVAPGFDYRDFELLDPRDLALRFPQHAATIARQGAVSDNSAPQ